MTRPPGSSAGSLKAERPAVASIALVGAECTGKTSLAGALAEALPALWLPEVLRTFCERLGRTPRPDEQAGLVRAQHEAEAGLLAEAARAGLAWAVLDSTPLVTALYSCMLFGDDALLEPAVAHQRRYTLTLLTDTDLPWEADGILRGGPAERARFHALLVQTLETNRIPHLLVGGGPDRRLAIALAAARCTYNPAER